MANMGHCRFTNTLQDLRDCWDSPGMYAPELLSEEERRARGQLIEICAEIADELGDEWRGAV